MWIMQGNAACGKAHAGIEIQMIAQRLRPAALRVCDLAVSFPMTKLAVSSLSHHERGQLQGQTPSCVHAAEPLKSNAA